MGRLSLMQRAKRRGKRSGRADQFLAPSEKNLFFLVYNLKLFLNDFFN
jgi:hypothetical protein